MSAASRTFSWNNPLSAIAVGVYAAGIALAPTIAAKAILLAPLLLLAMSWWTLHTPARWVAAFFVSALLLPPLPIPLGDSGPHPSMVFAALGAFAGLLWLAKWSIPPNSLNGAMVALPGILLASVAPAIIYSGPEHALASLMRVALFAISIYIFFYTAYGPGQFRNLRLLYWVAVTAALFACVDFYFQLPAPAGYGPQFVWLESGVYRRAQGLFYEASTLGNFCAFFLVMIAVAFSRPPAELTVSRKGLAMGGAILLAALILSYSRGSLVNVIVALGVLFWINRKRLPVWKIAAVGAVTGIVLWQALPEFAEMYWLRLSGSVEFFFSATDGVLSGRVQSWTTLAAWMAANPWQTLLGIGYKTLPYTNYLGAPVVADNMYLSLLIETGVAGLAAVLWLNFAILRSAARAVSAPDRRRSFFGTWMLCFWAGQMVQMASGDLLTYWRVLPVYFWALAMAQ
jgi:hypothetical protein